MEFAERGGTGGVNAEPENVLGVLSSSSAGVDGVVRAQPLGKLRVSARWANVPLSLTSI